MQCAVLSAVTVYGGQKEICQVESGGGGGERERERERKKTFTV